MSANLLRKLLVFFFSFGAYVPLTIGGWQHPEELNIATYAGWTILTFTLTYAAIIQKYEGWILTFGFFFGNFWMVMFGLCRGGYTFNLDQPEYTLLFGFIGVVCLATLVWFFGYKSDVPRVLYVGSVCADIASFYPQIKQYLVVHEAPTFWIFIGYTMFLIGVALTIGFVEKLFQKLWMKKEQYAAIYEKQKSVILIVEESFFSIENVILLPITVYLMAH